MLILDILLMHQGFPNLVNKFEKKILFYPAVTKCKNTPYNHKKTALQNIKWSAVQVAKLQNQQL